MTQTEIKCEGTCPQHRGEVIRVRVTDPVTGYNFTFNYCEAAIEEDMRGGFRVEILFKPATGSGKTL